MAPGNACSWLAKGMSCCKAVRQENGRHRLKIKINYQAVYETKPDCFAISREKMPLLIDAARGACGGC
jgi:hypothetical protein